MDAITNIIIRVTSMNYLITNIYMFISQCPVSFLIIFQPTFLCLQLVFFMFQRYSLQSELKIFVDGMIMHADRSI